MRYIELKYTFKFFQKKGYTNLENVVNYWLLWVSKDVKPKESLNYKPVNIEQLKIEIAAANSSKEFSWKELARETNFVLYSEKKSDAEIFLDLKIHIWEHLYPKDAMSLWDVECFIIDFINLEDWVSFDEMIDKFKEIYPTANPMLDYYNIYRFLHRRARFELKHEEGTYKYYVRLHPKKRNNQPSQLKSRRRRRDRRKKGDTSAGIDIVDN